AAEPPSPYALLAAHEHEGVADREAALLGLREGPVGDRPAHAVGERSPLERRGVDLGVLDVPARSDLEAHDRLARALIAVLPHAQEAGAHAGQVLPDHA